MKTHSLVERITLLQQSMSVLIVLSFAALALVVTHAGTNVIDVMKERTSRRTRIGER